MMYRVKARAAGLKACPSWSAYEGETPSRLPAGRRRYITPRGREGVPLLLHQFFRSL
jgi:hypothetical protein